MGVIVTLFTLKLLGFFFFFFIKEVKHTMGAQNIVTGLNKKKSYKLINLTVGKQNIMHAACKGNSNKMYLGTKKMHTSCLF